MTTQFPSVIHEPAIAKAAQEWERLLGEQRRAEAAVVAMQEERAGAVKADRHALAEALRKGGKEPADTAVTVVERKLATALRRAEALAVAAASARADLDAVVSDHRAAWQAHLDGELAEALGQAGVALDKLAAVHDRAAGALAATSWLATYPNRPFLPGGHLSVVRDLVGPSGDAMAWPAVLGALRAHLLPHEQAS